MEVEKAKSYAGVYAKSKIAQDKWRANQEKINEYYRNKRAAIKLKIFEEKRKQIALEYLAEQIENLNKKWNKFYCICFIKLLYLKLYNNGDN